MAQTNDTPQGLGGPLVAGPDAPHQDAIGVQPGFAAQAAATRPSRDAGRDAGRAMRLVALVAVVIGLAALTAAACILSYSSMHHLAIQAYVSARLASVYPLIFDALLVLAGCSVLALRGAGLVSRMYAWLCMLVLLGGLAAGGALHAAGTRIPHRLAGVVAAIVPWVLVLIGFGLMLALLRYARIRRLGQHHARATAAGQGGWPLPDPAPSANSPPQPPAAVPLAPAGHGLELGAAHQADLQLRARIPMQLAHGQADSNAVPAPVTPVTPVVPVTQDEPDAAGQPESELNPAPIPDGAGEEASGPPAFRRTRSSPTPPQEQG